MQTSFVEVRVRTFFTCDEAELAPAVSIVVARDKLSTVDLQRLVDVSESVVEGVPSYDLRSMTLEETKAFREDQE